MVTAPGSGAETIPFLKTWVNLPMAIGFTVIYAKVQCLSRAFLWKQKHLRTYVMHGMDRLHIQLIVDTLRANRSAVCAQLANVLSTEALFYACILPFIAFFGAFAFIMYPLRDVLHPTGELAKGHD